MGSSASLHIYEYPSHTVHNHCCKASELNIPWVGHVIAAPSTLSCMVLCFQRPQPKGLSENLSIYFSVLAFYCLLQLVESQPLNPMVVGVVLSCCLIHDFWDKGFLGSKSCNVMSLFPVAFGPACWLMITSWAQKRWTRMSRVEFKRCQSLGPEKHNKTWTFQAHVLTLVALCLHCFGS